MGVPLKRPKIVVAGAVGFVTGGVAGRLTSQAANLTISTTRATATTAIAGGTANAGGTVVNNALNGEVTTPKQAGASFVAGAAGAGFGSALANGKIISGASGELSTSSALVDNIVSTTRSAGSRAGNTSSFAASAGQAAFNVSKDAAIEAGSKLVDNTLSRDEDL